MYRWLYIFLFSTFAFFSFTAFAATDQPNNEEVSIGKPGDPSKVARTINLTLLDNMFLPPEITVREGETIQFVLKNLGSNTHHFLIGTADVLRKVASSNRKNEQLIRLNPSEEKELIWEFNKAGTVNFACPIKTHFKTMHGKITVEND